MAGLDEVVDIELAWAVKRYMYRVALSACVSALCSSVPVSFPCFSPPAYVLSATPSSVLSLQSNCFSVLVVCQTSCVRSGNIRALSLTTAMLFIFHVQAEVSSDEERAKKRKRGRKHKKKKKKKKKKKETMVMWSVFIFCLFEVHMERGDNCCILSLSDKTCQGQVADVLVMPGWFFSCHVLFR